MHGRRAWQALHSVGSVVIDHQSTINHFIVSSSHHLIIHPYSHPASIARSLEPWPCSPRWHRLSRRAWASLCQLLVSTCPSLLSASSRLPVVSLRSVLERPLASPLDPLASTLVHPPPVRDSRRATGVLLLLTPTRPLLRPCAHCRDVRKVALTRPSDP